MTETTTSAAAVDTPPARSGQSGLDPSGGMELTARDVPGGVVVTLVGELDIATAPMLDSCLRAHFRAPAPQSGPLVVIDLSKVTFCDCSGLNALLRALRLTQAVGGWLGLCGAPPGLRNIMRVTRVSPLLCFYPTAAEALTASESHQIPVARGRIRYPGDKDHPDDKDPSPQTPAIHA